MNSFFLTDADESLNLQVPDKGGMYSLNASP